MSGADLPRRSFHVSSLRALLTRVLCAHRVLFGADLPRLSFTMLGLGCRGTAIGCGPACVLFGMECAECETEMVDAAALGAVQCRVQTAPEL
eukprot:877697-Rhodomonas_salina.2